MENKKKSIKIISRQKKINLKFEIPAKIIKMKSAQNELKIDFTGFQTMGMNVAMSEFEYHDYFNFQIQIPAKNLKMKSAQIELKIDFPGFQTTWMNVATSE